MKIITIVGTRPNLVKEYALHQKLREQGIEEVLVHTGQHYDYEMSEIFFKELRLPKPNYVNNVIKGSHAAETAAIMKFVEDVLLTEKPDMTLVFGDVNSTLAAAVASAKLAIPVAHVEAGIRTPFRSNPEEINRRVADTLSELLFCVSREDVDHLLGEGVPESSVFWVGDVLLDALNKVMSEHRIETSNGGYGLVTVHRAENVDHPERLKNIVDALLGSPLPIRFPLHPRTRKNLKQFGLLAALEKAKHVELLPPLGFLDFVRAMAGAQKILTDSGGVRREGYMLGKPVITLIGIEWFGETVRTGWNRVADAGNSAGILEAIRTHQPQGERPAIFGDGKASDRIAAILSQYGKEGKVLRDPGLRSHSLL